MIKVIKGTVKVNGKSFKPGQIISSLSEEDEASLISIKAAEPWGMAKTTSEDDDVETDPDDMEKDKEDPSDVVSTNDEPVGNKPIVDTDKEQVHEEPEPEPEAQPELETVKNEGTVSIKFDAEAYVGGSDNKKQKGVKK